MRPAKVLHLSLDAALQFKAVAHMPEEERRIIKARLDGMIIKYQTSQIVGNLSS